MGEVRDRLHFNGAWRVYQKRVLDNSAGYLTDKRIHIVAAPGSGKTTLGIELIGRLGEACLILSPSITIRDQWISRTKEAFLREGDTGEGLLSNNIRKAAPITAITYQALHSCMTRYKGILAEGEEKDEEIDEEIDEEVDFSGFDFFDTIHKLGIKTICLDEAHHLRSEWWKALEEMMKKLADVTVISLTATPPYDSTPAEWERYIGLCGPIDEEIIVPELVKEGSLCPHQDYVYFNMPTPEEEQAVIRFKQEADAMIEKISGDPEFLQIIRSHKGLMDPNEYMEQFLDKPEYLSSLLIFLQSRHIPFSKELICMLGTNEKLPKLEARWMERLLQGFLFDDKESYLCDKTYREQLAAKLKGAGLIRKNKICLTANESINKLLQNSKGKIKSIIEIIKAEYKDMDEELRLLILTDYIKKDYISAIGNPAKAVDELGVVPIFENIRREIPDSGELRMGVLSGSVVIIPEAARTALEMIMGERGIKGSIKACEASGYYMVTVSGTETTPANLLTELFNQGYIRVLIGTKSLLGEGWDSPCINTLILASFVGSFMLSNQMRGRAIRTMKGNPDKVSNVWHLICMEPKSRKVTLSGEDESGDMEESNDFKTLKRRFEGFLGVHYDQSVIESGWERMSCICPPYSRAGLKQINRKMVSMAADRKGLSERWQKALVVMNKMEVADEVGVDKGYTGYGVVFINMLGFAFLYGLAFVLAGIVASTQLFKGNVNGFFLVFSVGFIFFFLLFVRYLSRLLKLATPLRYMKSIGKAILNALQEMGNIIGEHMMIGVEEGAGSEGLVTYTYLKGGTQREKRLFADTLYQFFGTVDNQRYLLKATEKVPKLCRYYCVPDLFARKKEDAMLFHDQVKKYIGKYELVYTRNPEGRKVLLEARIHSYANKSDRCCNTKKRVKSAFE